MSRITMIVGVALIALGVGFFIAAGATMEKATALIPAAFGLPVAICGALGAKGDEKMRKHTAHIAVIVTLLYLGAIESAAREVFFGAIMAACALLFLPPAAVLRAVPVFILGCAWLLAMSAGLLPRTFFS